MRSSFTLGLAFAGLAAAVALSAACSSDLTDCSAYPHAGCPGEGGGSAPTGSTTTTSTTTSSMSTSTSSHPATSTTGTHGGGGSSGSAAGGNGGAGEGGNGGGGASSSSTTMVNCDPTAGPVDGTCGVFVSSSIGADGNAGTKNMPVATLAHAIELATTESKPIYACGEEFDEAITVPAGSTLFGGFDCEHGWRYAPATPTKLVGAADQIPLTLAAGASSSALSDFSITAADSVLDGGSSIGVLASSDATLTRLTIVTGRGHDGSAGAAQTQVGPAANGVGGTGDPGCTAMSKIDGGDGGIQTCGGTDVSGGLGGTGTVSGVGGSGTAGSPAGMGTFPTDGVGGTGQSGGACSAGDAGGAGPPGNPGAGAHGLGQLSALGYVSPSATTGASAGTPGQGGGGGGGAKPCAAGKAGPSGGGGGGGGCGGAVGNAGHSGGSSIGIAASGGMLTLNTVTITTAQAGNGGLGGDGQPGGTGGQGNLGGGAAACNGGNGGQGGRGGSGGGGAGGHSVGIALQGSGFASMTGVNILPNNKGAGAIGGDGNVTAGAKGDDGMACKTLDMGTGACGM